MDEYLKLTEVSRRLDVSEKTARRYVKAGALPSVFIGGAYRVSEADLEKFLEGARVHPGKAGAPPSPEPPEAAAGQERRVPEAWGLTPEDLAVLDEVGLTKLHKALDDEVEELRQQRDAVADALFRALNGQHWELTELTARAIERARRRKAEQQDRAGAARDDREIG